MKVEIYTVVKDAMYILPYYIEHYKSSFPGCKINMFDNGSTDGTIEYCLEHGCTVTPFLEFKVYIREDIHQKLNNNIWKTSDADWIIVCDVDELIQITEDQVLKLDPKINIIHFKGYNMVDKFNLKDPTKFNYGFPSLPYDKCCMFTRGVGEINYTQGAHECKPTKPVYSKHQFKLLHYNKCWFNVQEFLKWHSKGPKAVIENIYNNATKKLDKVK